MQQWLLWWSVSCFMYLLFSKGAFTSSPQNTQDLHSHILKLIWPIADMRILINSVIQLADFEQFNLCLESSSWLPKISMRTYIIAAGVSTGVLSIKFCFLQRDISRDAMLWLFLCIMPPFIDNILCSTFSFSVLCCMFFGWSYVFSFHKWYHCLIFSSFNINCFPRDISPTKLYHLKQRHAEVEYVIVCKLLGTLARSTFSKISKIQ